MHASGKVDLRIYLAKKNHGYSISAQSYDFYPHLIQLDILDFTLSRISAAKQKIRPRNLKIRLLSDHIFTKNQTKSGPKLAILRSKSDLFLKHYSKIKQINFYLKIFHTWGHFQVIFLRYVEGWQSENQTFGTFLAKKRTFQAKRGPI